MNEDELKMLVQIASGLLASGHYTGVREEGVEGGDFQLLPYVKSWDAGKHWEEETVEKHRFNYHVIEDALVILDRLKESLVLE